MYNTKRNLEEVIARLEYELTVAKKDLAAINNPYGSQPPPGTDIKWYVRYTPNGKQYTFLAHRADDGLWYTTSKHNRCQRWDALIAEWKKHDVLSSEVYLLRNEDTLHLRKMRQQQ